ncbi:MAG: hypothetical protein IKK44_04480 [Clostridium sp.]|nr:hypothetical protein [Clostridium sp.]
MDREWAAILARYGQRVTVRDGEGEYAARAFLQPVREKGEAQLVPTPLGARREERYLYLGSPDIPLTVGETAVDWAGRAFAVWSARQVYAGREPSHWWAILRPFDKEGAL